MATGTLAVTTDDDFSTGVGRVGIRGTLAVTNAGSVAVGVGTVGTGGAFAWPVTGTGTARVTTDQNRVYARVGDDTNPTRVIKSGSGSTTAVLIDWLLDPVDLTGYTVTFDVARNGINVASTACTLTTPAAGLVTFTFPTLAPGTYTARFTVHYNSLEWSYPVDGLEVQV